ncbi:MAG: hypothetical protein M1839_008050 [Geoglossum umbratile]|nr:MAG: hypothetical protein M1839_008050 [Geoglossum umbratile]
MSFLSSTPPDSPLSASPENAENLMKAYLAEERERSKREDRGPRGHSSRSSVSSSSSTEAPAWRTAGCGSPNGATAPDTTINSPRTRDPISCPSSHSGSSRGRTVKVRRPTGESIPTDSRSPSRGTESPHMYRLTPFIRPPVNGASLSRSAPNLLAGAHTTPDGQFLVRPLVISSVPSRGSSTYLQPNARRADDEHRRSRSLSSIAPATARPSHANKGSFYLSPTDSPYLSSDSYSSTQSPLPSYLSARPMTPPADVEPLPAPISPPSERGSESEEVEFGEAAGSRGNKGSRFGRLGRRNSGSPTLEPPEPKTLVSVPYVSTSKPLISVPYSSTVSLDSKKPVTENTEETRGRPRIQRTNSGSKKKSNAKSSVHIPMPEYKKKPTFTVPSLPSLAQRKKWAVGDRMSGLFSGRIFNRMEVKEIIDTSVKNYDSMDPSRRYSRARDVGHSTNPGPDTDSDSASANSVMNKPLPPPPTFVPQRPSTAPSPPTAPAMSARPQDSSAVEPEKLATEPEPKMLKGSFDGMRGSFLMDPKSQVGDGNGQSPVIDITNDLAMAVVEEESALPLQLRNRRLYQNPSLPPIPELSLQTGKKHSRKVSPTAIAATPEAMPAVTPAATPAVPTRSLSPSGTGTTPKPHLTPTDPGSAVVPASDIPPPIPPKSASRASYILTKASLAIPTSSQTPTPTAATAPKSSLKPYTAPTPATAANTNLDWTAFNKANTGGVDFLGKAKPDVAPDDSLVDWFRTYNFDGVGTLVRGPSTAGYPSPKTTATPPPPPPPPTTTAEDPVPPLESDTDADPDAATSLTSASNRTSSLLQPPTAAGTDTDGVSVHEEEKVKMACNFNDGSLGDFLSWEANLLRVVGDGGVEE